MAKKIISLNIDKAVYDKYSKRCKDAGIIMSKQVENFMKERLKQA